MSIHRYHPDSQKIDPPEAVLWDDCERCLEHAEDITSLDDGNLRSMWNLMEDVELHGGFYRTHTEAQAGRFFWKMYLVGQRLGFIEGAYA